MWELKRRARDAIPADMAIVFTQVDIAASAEDIWQILTDFARYPAWNPILRKLEQEQDPSAKFVIDLHPPGQINIAFRVEISERIPNLSLAWLGHCWRSDFLSWDHRVEIEPYSWGCTLRQTARLTGHLIKATPNFMMIPIRNGFAVMNERLRDRVEDGVF